MNFLFWILIGIFSFLLMLLVFCIMKASGLSEYRTALIQCRKCKHFINGDPDIRVINCKKYGSIPVELTTECEENK